MSDLNAINLIEQMRAMSAKAEGMGLTSNPSEFNSIFQQALSEVSQMDKQANIAKAGYEMGDPNFSLAETMIAGQKSNLGFEATLRVRNQLVKAYQEIMTMPI